MATDLSASMAGNAQGLAQARGDSGSVRQHRLRDPVDADRHLGAKDALADRTRKAFGVRVAQLAPLVAPASVVETYKMRFARAEEPV